MNENTDIYLTDSLKLKKLTLHEKAEFFHGDLYIGFWVLLVSIISLIINMKLVLSSAIPVLRILIPFGVFFLGVLIINGGATKHYSVVEKNKLNEKENHQARSNWISAAETLHSKWKSAYRRWEQCYYCHRDDVIFIPSENIPVAPPELIDYLYKDNSR